MGGEAISKAQLYSLLQVFTERDWVISENNNWLSLVIDPLFKIRFTCKAYDSSNSCKLRTAMAAHQTFT